jgi:serine/threonine protein kinase/Leucine-rich repeat (LRR) protein
MRLAGRIPLCAIVEALLRAAECAGEFLEQPPPGLTRETSPAFPDDELSEKPGDRIGRYKLLEKIGEGGCGAVYMAEQEEPVRRRVALKIIKPGMDTRAVVARFEAERQALALMDHPNIARVLDGGATETLRPYFVMELVRGVPITTFCDEARLPTAARLRLFIQVCQAIQHAHQKGIIHRDLKPSNILVTVNDGAPVPRVIDFGIAKATGQRLTDKTLFTQFHAFIGTPAYTSPEQAEMSSVDIDTRSDIYSLGVLLYELLTDRTPFDGEQLLSAGLDEMRRIIRDQEPPRPSTRLGALGHAEATAVSGKRKSSVPELTGDLRGDLDWIVMKCLEKDRSRRYETANGLAADVQRHLQHEPIVARPPGQLYRFRKLVRRNRVIFVSVAAVAVALLAGTAVSISQARRAQRGEERANAALADLRASAPAYAAQAYGLAAKAQYEEALDKLDYALKLRPDSTGYLLTKGNLLESRLQFRKAAAVYRSVLELDPKETRAKANLDLCERFMALPGPQSPEWTDALVALYTRMALEERSLGERGSIGGAVVAFTARRLEALNVFSDPVSKRLTMANHGLLCANLADSTLQDFSLLHGLPLSVIAASGCPVTDLRPLREFPLTSLDVSRTKVSDLTPLQDMHTLESLSLQYSSVRDLSPVQNLRSLWWINLSSLPIPDLTSLRGLPLRVLRMGGTQVNDLALLSGMPLEELDVTSIPAADFTPLAGCQNLKEVYLSNTALKQLDVFRGRKLVKLHINGTAVRDLSPLAGMPLRYLRLQDTPVTDVAPLLRCPTLESIVLPDSVQNAAVLRTLPNLRRISCHCDRNGDPAQIASEFWREFDAPKEVKP